MASIKKQSEQTNNQELSENNKGQKRARRGTMRRDNADIPSMVSSKMSSPNKRR